MTCIQILLEKKGIDRGYFDLRRQIINCTLQLYYSDFQLNCIIVTSGKLVHGCNILNNSDKDLKQGAEILAQVPSNFKISKITL